MAPSRRAASHRAVLVGAAQLRRKPDLDGPWEPLEPASMMADAVQQAAKDAGDLGLLQEADLLACVEPVAWAYDDLPRRVGELAGTTGPASPHPPVGLMVPPGGNSPCELLNEIANRIAGGDCRVALLTGAEAFYSRRRARRDGIDLTEAGWSRQLGHRDFLKGQRPLTNALESRHGLFAPVQCYPLYENALRAEFGRSVAEHQKFLGELMAAHAAVAAENPYAWFRDGWSAEEIRTVTTDNRWICFPYPKRMNAIMEVDQAAALVVMTQDEADRRGVAPQRRVAFAGGASATDAWTPTERASFTDSPAYRRAAAAACEHAGLYPTEVDLFDLYSCFPSAVEMAMKALVLTVSDPRPRTVTGGLAYAGGPGNNYSMHALCAMVERLRSTRARVGFVSALGMTATKHAVSILAADPARIAASSGQATPHISLPSRVTQGPRLIDQPEAGAAIVETYTVEYDRDNQPVRTVLVLKLADGGRTVANGDLADANALVTTEGVGRRGRVTPGEGDSPNQFALATADG